MAVNKGDAPELITLRFDSLTDDIKMQIKISNDTPFEGIMKCYRKNFGINKRFLYDGKEISESDTPLSIGMEDEDSIEVDNGVY
ncbi:small ubiquitin-related modifier 2-A-like [Rhopalosiphum maidis]|uniref:small ubiquitin-related modifier 2-A-like n=1 Tax=Rhopalosiphum maidis TaxID=43146 RepID=UPI000EFE1250|nr:small ubiquitin-related modifier 2-A-like [Rhopalosiphum maidis]